ncbi:glycerophosphoryl diester phosphodiesterase [Amphritea opalescens]|uniref:Glycerophosphoryl diester phosphodiesterase n=1 Tax=Amphritea opalescens TaxID=2490544 RepID=A0A430KPN7_9GAMM|nr:glycerophosphodiester phosphodiesterase family protein [Amphritea opalescens]RTE65440.1 glycerophosphoryl diester phosphodiesterase [Amphritea opalescens]
MNSSAARVMGHRGVPSLAPENTLGGFIKAIELGARWLELDVTLLGDLTPVVHHDNSLDRCSDGSGLLSQLALKDLDNINNAALFPDWPFEPVPTLKDVLVLLMQKGVGLNLEIKRHQFSSALISQIVVDQLLQHFLSDKLVVSSFDVEVLAECLRLAPEIPRGLICSRLPSDWQSLALELELTSIHCDGRYLNQAQTLAIKDQGYRLFCWTINDALLADRLWGWGIDGLMTDYVQDFIHYYDDQ